LAISNECHAIHRNELRRLLHGRPLFPRRPTRAGLSASQEARPQGDQIPIDGVEACRPK
jgi:hypothetical protein